MNNGYVAPTVILLVTHDGDKWVGTDEYGLEFTAQFDDYFDALRTVASYCDYYRQALTDAGVPIRSDKVFVKAMERVA